MRMKDKPVIFSRSVVGPEFLREVSNLAQASLRVWTLRMNGPVKEGSWRLTGLELINRV